MGNSTDAPDPHAVTPRQSWLGRAGVAGLLAFYFLAATTAWSGKSVTFDETFHLVSGYSYWLFSDFRLQPENGNLPQRWAALPLLLSRPDFPSGDQLSDLMWKKSDKRGLGERLIYSSNVSAERLLWQGRAMIALATVGMGLFVFIWARRLWGEGPAWLALILFTFCPTMLSHGCLITSDAVTALCFLCAQSSVWSVLQRVTPLRVLVSSVVMSAVMVAKFSAPLIIPMALVLVVLRLIVKAPLAGWLGRSWEISDRAGRVAVLAVVLAVHVAVAWCLIWAAYSFRYEMFANSEPGVDAPERAWSDLLDEKELPSQIINYAREHKLLPEAYLYGYAYTFRYSRQRSSFFNGEYSIHGWRTFFPYCLLAKTPPELFVLMGLALAALWWRWRKGTTWRERWQLAWPDIYRSSPLWSLFLIYWATAIVTNLNIGNRHILPTYPPMYILAAGAVSWMRRKADDESPVAEKPATTGKAPILAKLVPQPKGGGLVAWWRQKFVYPWLAMLVIVMGSMYALESLTSWPNYLTYFNIVAGGPRNGYKHLVDSSLDWGQDLPALKRWIDDDKTQNKSKQPVYVSYFGTGSPAYYKIEATFFPCFFELPRNPVVVINPGVYCISATMLQSVYNAPYQGPWNDVFEQFYQQRLTAIKALLSNSATPAQQKEFMDRNPGPWQQVVVDFEQLQFARLCAYLRQRPPAQQINYSIMVYRLTEKDIREVIHGPPPERAPVPEHLRQYLQPQPGSQEKPKSP